MTDADLIQRTLSGDTEAFSGLITRHQGAVQALAYHTLGSFDDARDAAQETLIQAYLKLGQLREPERFAGWLRRMTLNCCRSLQRGRRETASLEDAEPVTDESTPSDVLAEKESREALHGALGQLRDRGRLVITLRYLGGMSYKEIARFLDVPLSTVEGRMHRAKQELRGRLMDSVEKGLKGEQLPEDFAKKVLDEALERARKARKGWDREAFVRSCEQAMEAATRLADGPSQVAVLQMMGEAETSWLGKPEKAVADYELALKVAREHQARAGKGEVDILKSLYLAHLRHGEYDRAGDRAQEAMERSQASGDTADVALARGALDLAHRLPDAWKPGERGGYAAAAFQIEESAEGLTFRDPVGERDFTFGCPSRVTAFIHLLVPRRLFGPSVEPGVTWTDREKAKLGAFGWRTDDEQTLLAQTSVEASRDTLVTPAGQFEDCIRICTEVAPEHGGRSSDTATRSYCGSRTMWFAPGVGLVKLRHRDQDDNAWTVWLAEFGGDKGEDLFPLEAGRWWRYRWCSDALRRDFFEDLTCVVDSSGGVITLSSAAWAVQPSEAQSAAHLLEEAEFEKKSKSSAGEAVAMEGLLASEDRGSKAERTSWLERLSALCEEIGDEWRLAGTRCRLADLQEDSVTGSMPAHEERVAVARGLGEPLQVSEALKQLGIRQREAELYEASADHLEEAASIAGSAAEADGTAQCVSEAELSRALLDQPRSDTVGYANGWAFLAEKEPGKLTSEITCHGSIRPYPPGPAGTPMTDIFMNGPFMGIELLRDEPGGSLTDYWNVGTSPGPCESMRWTSTLAGREERLETPAGRFDNAILIDTTIATSDQDMKVGPELEGARGYRAGRRQTWFAPGVGLLRVLYTHRNGLETDIQLVEYDLQENSDDPLPLAIGNRWRYLWTDPTSGTEYEDSLRVASHSQGKWYISFVTRAKASSSTPDGVTEDAKATTDH